MLAPLQPFQPPILKPIQARKEKKRKKKNHSKIDTIYIEMDLEKENPQKIKV